MASRAAKPTEKKPLGRPSTYSPELAAALCGELAEGKSLRSVCRRDDMPGLATVFLWLREHPDFIEQYTRAKDESADALAEDIMEIADDVRDGKLDPNAGRVAGDLKKWSASKLKPKKYGDHLDLTSKGDKLPTPIVALDVLKAQTPDEDVV